MDASGHWMPKDALVSTANIAEILNSEYGYEFDMSILGINNYYNAMSLSPETNAVIEKVCGYKYELLVPTSSPMYYVDYCEEEIYEGDFLDTLLTPISNWDRRVDDGSPNGIVIAYHDMWTIRNGAYVDIKNLTTKNNAEKKILVLGDSYSWPITSYLSQDVGEIAALHPRYFSGDVKTYINYYQPALVLWIYQEGQLGPENELNFGNIQ